MTKPKADRIKPKFPGLRRRAEATLRKSPPPSLDRLSPEQVRKLAHELQVHQIELEAQNDALKNAQVALELARDRYADLYDFAPVGYITLGADGIIREANLTISAMLGVDRSRLLRRPFASFVVPEDEDAYYLFRRRADASSDPQISGVRLQKAGGPPFPARLDAVKASGPDGSTVIRVAIIDIYEREQMEERLRAALADKETLLREVHHRVKNNLQAMVSLIGMRAAHIGEETARRALKELEEQARTMSMVYERLYHSENLTCIEMASYLRELAVHVLQMFGEGRDIRIDLEFPAVFLSIEQAMPCGLIVNELTTNAMKYAFPPDFKGQPVIQINFTAEGQDCRLTINDNGVGLPPDVDWRSAPSLGLRLIDLLVTHQLGGTLNLTNAPGASFRIEFRKAL